MEDFWYCRNCQEYDDHGLKCDFCGVEGKKSKANVTLIFINLARRAVLALECLVEKEK